MDELVRRFEGLGTSVTADALDSLGHRNQILPAGISLISGPGTVAGRAATLGVVAVDAVPEVPYIIQFEALERLGPGEILVIDTPPVSAAFWGELLTTRAIQRGCLGAVINGYTRDLDCVRNYEFPLWCRGSHPADSAGRLDANSVREPIMIGEVAIETGDIVVADTDGIVVVPAAVATEVVCAAEEKTGVEDLVRDELQSGASVHEVFEKYGVM